MALTRKSGFENSMAMLVVGSALCTSPITPSGPTTGLYIAMPALLPALSTSDVMTSPGRAVAWSASAGTNPHCRRLPRPRSDRSRSFSRRRALAFAAASTSESWPSARRSDSRHATRHCSVPRWTVTSGAMTVRRSAPATGARIGCGSASVNSDSTTQSTRIAMSNRVPERAARATAALSYSGPTSTSPRRRESAPYRARRR